MAEPARRSAAVQMPRAALARVVAEQSPTRLLAAKAVPKIPIHQQCRDDLQCAALLLLLPSQVLGGRECLMLSNLLLKIVRSLKTGLVLWVRVGGEDDMLHFYREITSFSCLLKACKDIGLAGVTRLLHAISVQSASRL